MTTTKGDWARLAFLINALERDSGDESLINNEDFILGLIDISPKVIQFLPDEHRHKRKFIQKAVDSGYPYAIFLYNDQTHAEESNDPIHDYVLLCESALNLDGQLISLVKRKYLEEGDDKNLENYKALLEIACEQNPQAILKADIEVQELNLENGTAQFIIRENENQPK